MCHSTEAAQRALNLVQRWASAFGMAVGVGQGKTEAMLVRATTVTQAYANDVNGKLKKACAAEADDGINADPDSNISVSEHDDDEWYEQSDPTLDEPQQPQLQLRKGQAIIDGILYGTGTGRPLPYAPRPLPVKPNLPPLELPPAADDGTATPIPWTTLYKYLGVFVRSDLIDDHAYARVEKNIKAAAERLFPFHRLVRAWPIGLQLQLLQTIVLSIAANVMPLMTSMRSASESKIMRLDQLRKEIARSILRLGGQTRAAYVVSEACIGDVTGEIVMHRLRLLHALRNHPLRDQETPPIACRVLDIMEREAPFFNINASRHKHDALLAPWPLVTSRITAPTVGYCNGLGWQQPDRWWEISPYASVIARVSERERWIKDMNAGLDWTCHSFALRPPSFGKQHTAALHWSQRLKMSDGGSIAKLVPLSYLGPHGCSIIALSRRHCGLTSVLSKARQGNSAMQSFPFASSDPAERGKKKQKAGRRRSAGPLQLRLQQLQLVSVVQVTTTGRRRKSDAAVTAAEVAAAAMAASNRYKVGHTCHFCTDTDDGPHYDLWHVLFECPVTRDNRDIVAVRGACQSFLPRICNMIEEAVNANAQSMSDTRKAGVSHDDIMAAIANVRSGIAGYLWDSTPGRWLVYTLLLAMPFPAVAVRPDPGMAVWRREQSSRRAMNLRDMPILLPEIPADQYRLPELVGRLFDVTVLSRDVLRPLADAWCSMALSCLTRAGQTIRPMRAAAERRRAAAHVANVPQFQVQVVDAEP